MAEFSDSVAGNEDQATSADFHLEATDGGSLSLPDGFSISDTNFESDGSDLILTSADGGQLTVEGFFNQDNPPELVSADGAQISGDMASQLADGGQEISAGTDSAAASAGEGMIAANPSNYHRHRWRAHRQRRKSGRARCSPCAPMDPASN